MQGRTKWRDQITVAAKLGRDDRDCSDGVSNKDMQNVLDAGLDQAMTSQTHDPYNLK